MKLTQDQIDFFHQEGYLAIPNITTPEEAAGLQAIYDRLFASKAGRDSGDHLDLTTADDDDSAVPRLPQILSPSKYAPELAVTQLRANAETIARQLFGPAATFRGDHAIMKPALVGPATPWHQDQAYNSPAYDYEECSIWIPLQEATLENGCMHFVPGSQASDVVPHHPIGNDPRVVGLEADDPERWAASGVACPLPVGGATIHHCRSMHYTGPNRSSGPRRAYILAFGVAPTPRATPHDYYWLAQQNTNWQARAAAASKKA